MIFELFVFAKDSALNLIKKKTFKEKTQIKPGNIKTSLPRRQKFRQSGQNS